MQLLADQQVQQLCIRPMDLGVLYLLDRLFLLLTMMCVVCRLFQLCRVSFLPLLEFL